MDLTLRPQRMHVPSLSQRRALFGCVERTFSTSAAIFAPRSAVCRGGRSTWRALRCTQSRQSAGPVAYAHHEVQVRGYGGEVVIGCGAEVIARHRRSYEKADMVFDPLHFLRKRLADPLLPEFIVP